MYINAGWRIANTAVISLFWYPLRNWGIKSRRRTQRWIEKWYYL